MSFIREFAKWAMAVIGAIVILVLGNTVIHYGYFDLSSGKLLSGFFICAWLDWWREKWLTDS
jgi:hypothetical protein